MEIYLSHMVIFRVIEKVHLNTMIKNDVVQYVVTVLLVTIGTIIFSYICKRVIKFIEDKLLIKV